MLLRPYSLLVLIVFGLSSACAREKMIEVKKFRLFVASDEMLLHESIAGLSKRYNEAYGSPVLSIVSTEAESNSIIRFQDDLRMDGQKLGTGQWMTTTTMAKAMTLHGEVTTNRVEFGMELVFDEGNFLTKAPLAANPKSEEAKHLYHLFCHEIGHGMQMDHDDAKHSVMYPTIPEKANRNIDYASYFGRAQDFLGDPVTSKPAAASSEDKAFDSSDDERLNEEAHDRQIETLNDALD